jgi:hypothetical protein
MKLNRADIRLEYETFKRDCEEESEDLKKKIDRTEYLMNINKDEYHTKLENLNLTKSQAEQNIENSTTKLTETKNRKAYLEEENNKIKEDCEKMEMDYIIRIEKMNNLIEENKKKENEYNIINKELMEELIKIDKLINQKKIENN